MGYLGLLIIFFLAFKPAKVVIDPKLQKYVTSFEKYAKKYGKETKIDYSVTFKDLLGVRAGVCYYSTIYGGQEVFVDRGTFILVPEHLRISLIFHELAHCSFGREHNIKTYRGKPLNWMYPQLFFYDIKLIEDYIEALITDKDENLIKKLERK